MHFDLFSFSLDGKRNKKIKPGPMLLDSYRDSSFGSPNESYSSQKNKKRNDFSKYILTSFLFPLSGCCATNIRWIFFVCQRMYGNYFRACKERNNIRKNSF